MTEVSVLEKYNCVLCLIMILDWMASEVNHKCPDIAVRYGTLIVTGTDLIVLYRMKRRLRCTELVYFYKSIQIPDVVNEIVD
jgi:hypothetical protein